MLQNAPVLTARVEIIDDADAESPEVRPPCLGMSSCISAPRPLASGMSRFVSPDILVGQELPPRQHRLIIMCRLVAGSSGYAENPEDVFRCLEVRHMARVPYRPACAPTFGMHLSSCCLGCRLAARMRPEEVRCWVGQTGMWHCVAVWREPPPARFLAAGSCCIAPRSPF